MAEITGITQEFDALGNHRIVNNGNPVTDWAGYTQIAYWNGFVSATAYYLAKEAIVTTDAFCRAIAVQGLQQT